VKKNNQTKNSKAYSNMSKQEAKSLKKSLAQKVEYQKQWGQPPKPKVIYHGSPQEIHDFVLQPHYLAGDDPVIFGTPNRTLSICYLARWSDSDFYQYTEGNDGIIYLDEKYPNAFEKVYKGKTGYLYELDPSTFEWDYQLSRSEFISRREPIVLNFEFINVYDELQKEARLGNLKINRFQSQGKVIDNPKKKGLSAVIIKGNPYYTKYGRDADKYKKYYKDIASLLREAGYTDISYDDGEPGTEPRKADLWLGHSRGADRLRFAPKGTKTLKIDDYEEGGDNYSDLLLDKMHRLGYNTIGEFPVEQRPEPGAWHYTITQRLIDAINSTVRKTRTNPMIERNTEARKVFKSKTIYGNVVSLKVAETYLNEPKKAYNDLIRINQLDIDKSCSSRRSAIYQGNEFQDFIHEDDHLKVEISLNNMSFDMVTINVGPSGLMSTGYLSKKDKEDFLNSTLAHNIPKSKMWVSTTRVTQDLYDAVIPRKEDNQPRPPNSVALIKSSVEAANFCNELSRLHNLTPYYNVVEKIYTKDGSGLDLSKIENLDPKANGYRLLTLEEWYWLALESLRPDSYFNYNELDQVNYRKFYSKFQNKSEKGLAVAKAIPHCTGVFDIIQQADVGELVYGNSEVFGTVLKKVYWSELGYGNDEWKPFLASHLVTPPRSINPILSDRERNISFRIARNYTPLVSEITKHSKNISNEIYSRELNGEYGFNDYETANISNQGQQTASEQDERFSSFEIKSYDSDEDEYDINFDD
jgi:hypothetical protein